MPTTYTNALRVVDQSCSITAALGVCKDLKCKDCIISKAQEEIKNNIKQFQEGKITCE